GIQPAFGDPLNLKITGEYRASDAPGQRRTLVSVSAARTWPGAGKTPTFKWKELVQFSDFRAGANEDRTDVFTKSTLDVIWPVKGGFEVGVNATLFKN